MPPTTPPPLDTASMQQRAEELAGQQELLRKHSQSLSDDEKNWILHDNVAELYGIAD